MENQSSIKQIKHLEFDTFKLSFLLLIVWQENYQIFLIEQITHTNTTIDFTSP
jgi:hypothetical protein